MNDHKGPATKESVDAWFAERRAANRAKRESPITAADIRERSAARAAGSGRPLHRARFLPVVIGCAFLVGAGVVSLATNATLQGFAADHVTNQQRILQAESELASLPVNESITRDDYAARVVEAASSAEQAGRAVAELQQQYADLLYTGNAENADDAGPQHAYEAALRHQNDLAPYFAEHTYLADAGDSLVEGDIDPRFPWYIGYEADGVTVAPPATSTWALTGVNPTKTAGVFEVTWTNRNPATGDLYAWAVADFDSRAEVFGDLTVGKTTLGDRSATEIQLARK